MRKMNTVSIFFLVLGILLAIVTSYHLGKVACKDDIDMMERSLTRAEVQNDRLETQNSSLKQTLKLEAELLQSYADDRAAYKWAFEHTWDYKLMCQLVECEARDLSFEDKQKVASVIFNRIKSDKFPNTVMDVMVAQGQFTPIGEGTAYETEATIGTIDAVNAAIFNDNSNGALFFNDYYQLGYTEYYDHDLKLISRSEDISFYRFKDEEE